MNTWEKIWKVLDGNKTIICTFVMFVLQLTEVKEWMNPVMWQILTYVFGTLFAGSLIHHASKGKFSVNKN